MRQTTEKRTDSEIKTILSLISPSYLQGWAAFHTYNVFLHGLITAGVQEHMKRRDSLHDPVTVEECGNCHNVVLTCFKAISGLLLKGTEGVCYGYS